MKWGHPQTCPVSYSVITLQRGRERLLKSHTMKRSEELMGHHFSDVQIIRKSVTGQRKTLSPLNNHP